MKVYKFGGASVKDASGVKNILRIIQQSKVETGVIVVSAMGKMTNHFEKIAQAYFTKESPVVNLIQQAREFHYKICKELFLDQDHEVYTLVDENFKDLNDFLRVNNTQDFNFIYDQIVSVAELISTKICFAYIKNNLEVIQWLDARCCIITNDDYRRAKIDWHSTEKKVKQAVNLSGLYITQGFIAQNHKGFTTTLGREGSDYTAGIFAYCMDAQEVAIFKDVPGVLNADPRVFKETTLLHQISYKEAIEMAFYGASIIHPKTLQPLQRKKIPLLVKSFIHPKQGGTTITEGASLVPKTSCYIIKRHQILISIAAKDFSFIMENDISEIFNLLHQYQIKVNLIQNSAISFSLCIEDNFNNFDKLFDQLKLNYICLYNLELSLYTIRHYNQRSVALIEKDKEVLIKQSSRETVQLVTKSSRIK